MSANYRDLLKYAATGISSPDMTYYDKMRASTLMGGAVRTLTGIPPLSFKSNGKPLVSWSMKGNGSQQGTPTPDNPVMPEFVGVRTGNLAMPLKEWVDGFVANRGTIAQPSESYKEKASEYIEIPSNAVSVVFSGGDGVFEKGSSGGWRAIGFYDSNKKFVSQAGGTGVNAAAVDVPEGAVFMRVSCRTYGSDKEYMLNAGTEPLPYEPYGWAEKITCAGQTVPVYLGQTQTVRRIKKLVLTGDESYTYQSQYYRYIFTVQGAFAEDTRKTQCFCSHYQSVYNGEPIADVPNNSIYINQQATGTQFCIKDESIRSAADFKAFLAAQYTNGTPVTVWYLLAEPTTGIVNEPLAKIGDYADELHSSDAGVTIPTAKGQNTLTVETDLQQSEMTITGYIEESSPFPPDCPFECDLDYFIDDAIEWTIWNRTYTKLNDEYAVGAIVDLSGTGLSIALLMSPVSADAVAYRVGNNKFYSTGSITYNGKTWYYSDASYAEGRVSYSGLPLYETPMEYPYTQEQLTQFLQFIHAKNR